MAKYNLFFTKWLTGGLTDRLTDRPTNQETDQPINQLTDRLTDQPIDQSTDWLTDRLTSWLTYKRTKSHYRTFHRNSSYRIHKNQTKRNLDSCELARMDSYCINWSIRIRWQLFISKIVWVWSSMFGWYTRPLTFTHCWILSVFLLFLIISGTYIETTLTGTTKINWNEAMINVGLQEWACCRLLISGICGFDNYCLDDISDLMHSHCQTQSCFLSL